MKYITYSELINMCDLLVKDIKLTIDNKNGFEKRIYKVTGLSKNDLILASIFVNNFSYSFFKFELEFNPIKADFIIKDFIKDKKDYNYFHIPVFSILSNNINESIIFPWETTDLKEILENLQRIYNIDEKYYKSLEDDMADLIQKYSS